MRHALCLLLLAAAGFAAANPHPTQPRASLVQEARECREGGDFIRNAALSRDNGMSREAFLGRLEEDLAAIRSYPAALRWFVHNDADEAFLLAEVRSVYDAPQNPEEHRPGFIGRCLARPVG
jgi:hypothetical protein